MKKNSIKIVALCLAIVLISAVTMAGNEIEVWLDRTQVSIGDTVLLSIKADGGLNGEPDTSPLEKDFQILGTASSSSINLINGSMSRSTTWQITLQPKKEGPLTIPPLAIDGRQTKALHLSVAATPAPQADSGEDIFIETEALPDNPYERQQVIYQIRLFHAVQLAEGSLTAPQPSNTVVQQLGEDRHYEATNHNRHYQVIERTYALFPQQAGTLTISPPVFEGKVVERSRGRDPFNSFFGNDPFNIMSTVTKPVRITGQENSLTILPRPEDSKGGPWLPADSVELGEELQPQQNSVRAGEAITRTITITAKGQNGAALPELQPGEAEGFKIYPDKAEVKTEQQNGGIMGTSRQKTAFIPLKPGTFTLPPITLQWWNLKEDKMREITLPARSITVLPGDNPTPATIQPEPKPQNPEKTSPPAASSESARVAAAPPAPESNFLWPLVTLALATGWLCTLLIWQRERKTRKRKAAATSSGSNPPHSATNARREFLAACEQGDAARAHTTLVQWAAARWPANPPRGLAELASRLEDQEAADEITKLDCFLFSDNPVPWDGKKIAAQLRRLSEPTNNGKLQQKTTLPPLYP